MTFVEFAHFQDPFSKGVYPTVEKLRKEDEVRVRLVFKHESSSMHEKSEPAARAAVAAQKQGEFWAMHDQLFESQKAISKKGDAALFNLAEQIGLDVEQFKREFRSKQVAQRVEADEKIAEKIGVRGTPSFWINGVDVVGAQPYSKFESVIEQQLERARSIEEKQNLEGEELYRAALEWNKEQFGAK